MKVITYLQFIFIIIIGSCQPPNNVSQLTRKDKVEQVAKDFFDTFAQRKDWEKFCSFYREDLIFEDILLQIKLDSLWQFKKFYKWDEEGGNFQKLTPDQKHVEIDALVVNDSMAIGYGHLNPFYYYDKLIEEKWGMKVNFILYFDKNLKIKKQIDWIEYHDDVMESVIKRYRKQGIEKLPDWLDLTKD